jgi:hypothetical protein
MRTDARDDQVRGVETYFLSFATTQHAESVAARKRDRRQDDGQLPRSSRRSR